jgi:boron transporter
MDMVFQTGIFNYAAFLTLGIMYFQQDTDVALGWAQSAEILDGMVTRSRGEIKRLNSPKITSSGSTPLAELKGIRSPAYSPRITELRHERSPLGGRSSPKTGETTPSKLGEGSTSK